MAFEPRNPSNAEREPPPEYPAAGSFLCLVMAARVLGLPADYNQLARAYPDDGHPDLTLLRAARGLGLKARRTTGDVARLAGMPLPALAFMKDGSCILAIKAGADKLLVYDPSDASGGGAAVMPELLDVGTFSERWTGTAILLARRFSLEAAGEKFGLSWFLPVIGRFKLLFGEVFVASFFLQSFGLVTPLFSQVIIDKVLVHKGLSTLDILAVGIFVINTFEWLLSYLRSYVFSHTTNRVDVILGTKLFRHLLALPLPFFE